MDLQLGDVQETALIPLAIRANETKRENARIHDEKAVEIIDMLGIDTKDLDKFISHEGVVARTILFDRAVKKLLEKYPDAVCVNIGCGLDDRFSRVDNGRIRWFNIDLPDSIEVRRKFFPKAFNETEREHMAEGDILKTDWIGDIPKGNVTIVIAEGLLMYFPKEQVRTILNNSNSSFGRGFLLAELMHPKMMKEKMHDTVKHTNAKFGWGTRTGKELSELDPKLELIRESSFWDEMKKYTLVGKITANQCIENVGGEMTEIYLAEDHLLLKTGYGNPKMHSHSACHVLVGLHGNMRVITDKETVMCRGAILPSEMVHTVESFGEPLLVFLFDVTSTVSEQMQCFTVLEERTAEGIALSYQALIAGNPGKNYGKFFREVMGNIGIKEVCSRITDERILFAMRLVEEHLQDEVTAKDAARAVCLSESRFSHLFREQAGIAFSSWLVFRRLFLAYMRIADGESITDASLAAGFSTPSHFATVNKKMFGITARDLSGDYCLHRIADI